MRGSREPWAYGSLRVGIKGIFKVNVLSSLLHWAGRPLPGYGGTLFLMISQSSHEVFKETTVGTYFLFFSLYVFLPSVGRGGSVADKLPMYLVGGSEGSLLSNTPSQITIFMACSKGSIWNMLHLHIYGSPRFIGQPRLRGPADKTTYLSIVGSLMFATLGTRRDISCCNCSSHYNVLPLQMHLAAAKQALRHLGTTRQIRLHFPSSLNEATANTSIQVGLHGFTDSDWAGRRESIGGCTFIDGGPINWQAKPESVVALKSGILKAKTKHIDVKFHHTR